MPDFMPDSLLSWDAAFLAANTAAFWGWVILIFAPRDRAWLNAIPAYWLPLAVSAAYAIVLVSQVAGGGLSGGGDYFTLQGVRALASSDAILTAGWMHVVAFDLFIGAWAASRMDQAGLSRLLQAPILMAIFMAGPLGFLIAALVSRKAR